MVWTARMDQLPSLLRTACSRSLLDRFFEAFRTKKSTSGLLVRVVEMVCCESNPPTTIAGVATRLGVPEARIYRHWVRFMPDSTSPKRFHDWATLIRMVYISHQRGFGPGMVEELAESLGISPRTVHRLTERCLESSTTVSLSHPEETLFRLKAWGTRILPQDTA